MDFASGAVSKFVYGRMLTAALAWLSAAQGDRVGLATFTDTLTQVIPPSVRNLQQMLFTLAATKAEGGSRLVNSIEKIGLLTSRAGIVVLVSDFYEQPEAVGRAVDMLRMRGHDVIAFHLIDPAERDLPGDGDTTFEDMESGALLPIKPAELRVRYQTMMQKHQKALQSRLIASGADYVRLMTNEPLDRALHAYLDARLMRGRIR